MSEAENTPQAAQAVSVDIYDQIYHLRGTDPAYIEKLAALVDSKMRAVSAQGSTVDSLRVAVLAALNITDELFALRQRYTTLANSMEQVEAQATQSQTTLKSRADSLSGLLDSILEERKAG